MHELMLVFVYFVEYKEGIEEICKNEKEKYLGLCGIILVLVAQHYILLYL